MATSARCWFRSFRRRVTKWWGSIPTFSRAVTTGRRPSTPPALRMDLRDVTAEHLKGFDAVLHLAALSNDPLGDLNPDYTYDIKLHASVNLAKAAKQAGVRRFLFSSSCSLYGKPETDDPVDETARFGPITPYGESKIRGRAGSGASGGRRLQPDLPAKHDPLGLVSSTARRHCRQQSSRPCLHNGRSPNQERRNSVEAIGSRRGHQSCVLGSDGGSPRSRPQPSVQRGADRRELPDLDRGRHGRRDCTQRIGETKAVLGAPQFDITS